MKMSIIWVIMSKIVLNLAYPIESLDWSETQIVHPFDWYSCWHFYSNVDCPPKPESSLFMFQFLNFVDVKSNEAKNCRGKFAEWTNRIIKSSVDRITMERVSLEHFEKACCCGFSFSRIYFVWSRRFSGLHSMTILSNIRSLYPNQNQLILLTLVISATSTLDRNHFLFLPSNVRKICWII